MQNKSRDLATLGAAMLPTRDLLRVVGVKEEEERAAEDALGLLGAAREAALRPLASGARLVAAIELGRRAWMMPSPAGRRIRSPVDVAAICAPRMNHERRGMAVALDRRLRVARVVDSDLNPVHVLHAMLGAGVTRVVVALNKLGASAVPAAEDDALATKLQAACAMVDVTLLDVVLLGDDGFASLLRLGVLPAYTSESRYR